MTTRRCAQRQEGGDSPLYQKVFKEEKKKKKKKHKSKSKNKKKKRNNSSVSDWSAGDSKVDYGSPERLSLLTDEWDQRSQDLYSSDDEKHLNSYHTKAKPRLIQLPAAEPSVDGLRLHNRVCYEFARTIMTQLTCPMCHEAPMSNCTVYKYCLHRFCETCMLQYHKSGQQKRECPICKQFHRRDST